MKRQPSVLFLFFALAAAFVLPVACGDDGLGTGFDAGVDLSASADLSAIDDLAASTPGQDLAGLDFAGVSCGSETCGSGQVCCIQPDLQNMSVSAMCVNGSTCGDGGVPAACDGPEDCASGTPNCCADLSLGGGSMSVMGQASCTATCPGSASQGGGGGGMIKTKLCHGPADCSGYTGTAPIIGNAPFDKCCGYPGVALKFCAPGLITLVSNQITCN